MPKIKSRIPGQISFKNFNGLPSGGGGGGGDGSGTMHPGIYMKTNASDINYALTSNHAWTPTGYSANPGAHTNSLFGLLDNKKWFKGVLVLANWNKIETAQGVYDWGYLDNIFNTVAGLQKPNGQNKKVMLLLNWRTFDLGTPDGILPNYMMTQPTALGGYYKDVVLFPMGQNPPINAKRYDHCWAYTGYYDSAPTTLLAKGYNLSFYKFAPGFADNTLKTRYYAFLTALATRYNSHPAFGGIIPTESSWGVSPFVSFYEGNNRDQHYAGRLAIIKKMRELFPGSLVAEAINSDNPYYKAMSNAGVTDGLIANHVAFTTPDCHIGTNMNVGNILPVLSGKVPIVMQIQPLMMKSMTGNRPEYYDWPNNPTVKKSGDGILNNDPPTAQWVMDRIKYFKTTHFIYQHMIESNAALADWPAWVTYMDNSPYSNDPAGGMVTTVPQFPY